MHFQEFLVLLQENLTFTLEFKIRSVNFTYLECYSEAATCLSVR